MKTVYKCLGGGCIFYTLTPNKGKLLAKIEVEENLLELLDLEEAVAAQEYKNDLEAIGIYYD